MTGFDKEQLKKDIKEELLKSEILMDIDDEEGIKLSSLLSTLRKHWKLILVLTLLAGAISVVYSLILPNYYKSTASVYIFPKNNFRSLTASFYNIKGESNVDSGEVSLLNTSLISESMSEYIINKFGIATNPAVVGNKSLVDEDLVFDNVLKKYNRIVSINYLNHN